MKMLISSSTPFEDLGFWSCRIIQLLFSNLVTLKKIRSPQKGNARMHML